MKKIFLLTVLFSMGLSAQFNRFIYEYKYIPDSTKKENVLKEMMLLDITSSGSTYYSHTKFVADSASRADLEKQLSAKSSNINITRRETPGSVNYSVLKNYPGFDVFLIDRIGADRYKVAEDKKMTWKIMPETQQIGPYKAQKATTEFGGRKWTAWFTTEIPFQDGPYKFYGLPGLIVKLEDRTGSHLMTLVANKKIDNASEQTALNLPAGAVSFGMGGKEISVTAKQFKKAWKDYVSDPSKNMREMMMKNSAENTVVIKMKTPDGRELTDPNEMYKQMEKRVKENLKSNNNRIEPELYQ